MNGISVTYIYSACVVIETPNIRLVTDPWFTEGIYDGSWYHFPKVDAPLDLIGDVDAIYISHIHPDHYDPDFLRQYFDRYGDKPILIADHEPNYLFGKMRADRIAAKIVTEPEALGDTTIDILPHKTGSISDIDSALIVTWTSDERTHCVVNTNDVIFDNVMLGQLQDRIPGPVDILLCGYTGAGPYPQTYFDLDDRQLIEKGAQKKEQFLDRYRKLVETVDAKVNIPFAGKYLLGGHLTPLNPYRGVGDPVEVLAVDDHAMVLADAGGSINTADMEPTAVRTEVYSDADREKREREIANEPRAYERLIAEAEIGQLPIRRLLGAAIGNAVCKSEVDQDYYFLLRWSDTDAVLFNANRDSEPGMLAIDPGALPEPRSEVTIDPRYLFGLLTHVYHWNNAEVGSQFSTRRVPDVFVRSAQRFLNFLTV